MPELPEVENVKISLENLLIDRVILDVEFHRTKLRHDIDLSYRECLLNSRVISIKRIAKYLTINLENHHTIVVHLGMSGRLFVRSSDVKTKHDHIIFCLDNENYLVFNDIRRFGMIYICKSDELLQHKIFCNLGVEPLSDKFSADYLLLQCLNKKTSIKNILMNNKILLGIGNIYANEALFLARIHPARPASSLDITAANNLVNAVLEILKNAIRAGGTTLKDFVNGDNKPGYFSQELSVYGRAGKNCLCCNDIIIKIKQNGRSSFCCFKCQKC